MKHIGLVDSKRASLVSSDSFCGHARLHCVTVTNHPLQPFYAIVRHAEIAKKGMAHGLLCITSFQGENYYYY